MYRGNKIMLESRWEPRKHYLSIEQSSFYVHENM